MKKIILLALFLPLHAFASQCDQFFPNGKEIVVPNTKVLCNSFFVTVYDEKNVANVFSSELAQTRNDKVKRTNDFRADKRVTPAATPADYTNTGYDRGHMTPAADADTDEKMSDTFLMTNMTPQLPSLNRIAWKNLEVSVRDMPFKYVLTGAIYDNTSGKIGENHVLIPVSIYKVVYLKDGKTVAYIANNEKDAKVSEISLTDLEKKTKIKF